MFSSYFSSAEKVLCVTKNLFGADINGDIIQVSYSKLSLFIKECRDTKIIDFGYHVMEKLAHDAKNIKSAKMAATSGG